MNRAGSHRQKDEAGRRRWLAAATALVTVGAGVGVLAIGANAYGPAEHTLGGRLYFGDTGDGTSAGNYTDTFTLSHTPSSPAVGDEVTVTFSGANGPRTGPVAVNANTQTVVVTLGLSGAQTGTVVAQTSFTADTYPAAQVPKQTPEGPYTATGTYTATAAGATTLSLIQVKVDDGRYSNGSFADADFYATDGNTCADGISVATGVTCPTGQHGGTATDGVSPRTAPVTSPDITDTVTVAEPTDTGTPTVEPTDTGTPTVEPTDTGTPTVEPTDTGTPTVEPTDTGTPTVAPTVTETVTETATATVTATVTETAPGPTVTQTVPGPTVTQTVPGPTVTQTVPGPTVTATVTASPGDPCREHSNKNKHKDDCDDDHGHGGHGHGWWSWWWGGGWWGGGHDGGGSGGHGHGGWTLASSTAPAGGSPGSLGAFALIATALLGSLLYVRRARPQGRHR